MFCAINNVEVTHSDNNFVCVVSFVNSGVI